MREEFAKQYDIRTSMSEAESTSDQRKRRFEYDENDADKRKKEKRYPCEDSYLTPEERRNEVTLHWSLIPSSPHTGSTARATARLHGGCRGGW